MTASYDVKFFEISRNKSSKTPSYVVRWSVARKRAVFHALLEYAVELDELPANPLQKVKWKPPKTTATVDPRIVVNPRQAQELLIAVTYVGRRGRGRRLMALFACMYYAALRPAEVVGLRVQDCSLPASG
jgi:site-specific recombinase XerC